MLDGHCSTSDADGQSHDDERGRFVSRSMTAEIPKWSRWRPRNLGSGVGHELLQLKACRMDIVEYHVDIGNAA